MNNNIKTNIFTIKKSSTFNTIYSYYTNQSCPSSTKIRDASVVTVLTEISQKCQSYQQAFFPFLQLNQFHQTNILTAQQNCSSKTHSYTFAKSAIIKVSIKLTSVGRNKLERRKRTSYHDHVITSMILFLIRSSIEAVTSSVITGGGLALCSKSRSTSRALFFGRLAAVTYKNLRY